MVDVVFIVVAPRSGLAGPREQNEPRQAQRRCLGVSAASLATQLVVVQLILIAAVLVAVSAVSVEQTRASFQRVRAAGCWRSPEVLAANRGPYATPSGPTTTRCCPPPPTQLQATTGVDLVMVVGVDGVVVGQHRSVARRRADRRGPSWRPPRNDPGRPRPRSADRATWWPPPRSCPIPRTSGQPVRQLGIAVVGEEQPEPAGRAGDGRAHPASPTSGPPWCWAWSARCCWPGGSSGRPSAWSRPRSRRVAEQREAIFTGIAEGVIVLDPSDRVTMVNPLAPDSCFPFRPRPSGRPWTNSRSRAGCATC